MNRGSFPPSFRSASSAALTILCMAGLVAAEAWTCFRGPHGAGVVKTLDLPTPFGNAHNLVGRNPLPAGHSSPVLTKDSKWGIHLTQVATRCCGRAKASTKKRIPRLLLCRGVGLRSASDSRSCRPKAATAMNSRVGRLGGHSHDSRNLTFLFRSREATTHRVYLNEVDTPLDSIFVTGVEADLLLVIRSSRSTWSSVRVCRI